MTTFGWKALPLVAILLVSSESRATEPTVRSSPPSFASATEYPAAVKTPSQRFLRRAPVSCEEVWRARLGLDLELLFDNGFEDGAVCSETWTDWLGACGPNEGCSGGSCGCNAGYSDCNGVAEDGCECAGFVCCAGACAPEHSNGLGQSYYDCAPLGVPGSPASYSLQMATSARAAWEAGADSTALCGAAQAVVREGASACAVWVYTTSLAGHVYWAATCFCPTVFDQTWN